MHNPMLLDLPKQFETPRLILRVPTAGDGKALHKTMLKGYENLVKWLRWTSTPPTIEEVELEVRQQSAGFILRNDMRFLCINKESGEFMGRLAYPNFQNNWAIPSFGISYFISEPYQGNGYCSEAVNAMTRYAFKFMEAKKVYICCDINNPKSSAVPKRLEFELEATQKGIWPNPDSSKLATIETYACFNPDDLPPLDVR